MSDEGLDGLLRAGQEHVHGVGEGDDLYESVDDVGQGLVVDQQNRHDYERIAHEIDTSGRNVLIFVD